MKATQVLAVVATFFTAISAGVTPAFGSNGIQVVDHGNGMFGEPVCNLFFFFPAAFLMAL
jgi:hypothetical protein